MDGRSIHLYDVDYKIVISFVAQKLVNVCEIARCWDIGQRGLVAMVGNPRTKLGS